MELIAKIFEKNIHPKRSNRVSKTQGVYCVCENMSERTHSESGRTINKQELRTEDND